ncbi:NfeD family protein [Mangrovicella endophytica]|uniref:NfeD family protein n=1 Tax=Mangrovicella endophytica TaxID=2066697 RepID=UPI000C9E2AB5|nr:NfeD family protein [Mangrovicella endophytica]
MTPLVEFVTGYGGYSWWVLGLVLLTLEVLAPGVYFLFFGIGALVVGTNALLLSPWFGWMEQVLAFIAVSVAAALVGRRWYGPRAEERQGESLNRRTDRLIGRTATLTEAIVGGRGRVAIEDSWWSVEGPDLPAGSRVQITGAESSLLKVAAAPDAHDLGQRHDA